MYYPIVCVPQMFQILNAVHTQGSPIVTTADLHCLIYSEISSMCISNVTFGINGLHLFFPKMITLIHIPISHIQGSNIVTTA
jgi:hypothetical protein